MKPQGGPSQPDVVPRKEDISVAPTIAQDSKIILQGNQKSDLLSIQNIRVRRKLLSARTPSISFLQEKVDTYDYNVTRY